jgi:hypothetical protein
LHRAEKLEEHSRNYEIQRDSITLNNLIRLAGCADAKPRFIYSHFNMPHPPYLFDKNKRIMDNELPMKHRYLSYLEYTNHQLIKAIDSILEKSTNPPILLLLSDHGYRNDENPIPEPLRFYNLAAIYRPDKNYTYYYEGMSNVNQFRVLLNQQFNQKLPLLKDSTVY